MNEQQLTIPFEGIEKNVEAFENNIKKRYEEALKEEEDLFLGKSNKLYKELCEDLMLAFSSLHEEYLKVQKCTNKKVSIFERFLNLFK